MIAEKIRTIVIQEMEAAGLSERALATLLGCTRENVHQFLVLRTEMRTRTVDKIMEVMNLELDITVRRIKS